jgi:UDP-N-acetylmuramate dehydrogenase
MKHFTNYNLKNHHTFATEAFASDFYDISEAQELCVLFKDKTVPFKKTLVIGQGSNLLFTDDFKGTIIRMNNRGIQQLNEDSEYVYLKASAGETWDDFVQYCIERNLYGAENLSYIPGTVGAAPVQNIGAYGAEVKDIIWRVHAFDIETKQLREFSKEECRFEYRNSIFKTDFKDRYIITAVDFVLKKDSELTVNYGSIAEEAKKYSELNLKNLRNIIISIRKSKLPEPNEIPNAGSFFKNPVVSPEKFRNLKKTYPQLVSYDLPDGNIKLAAGQLIDTAGFKGYRMPHAGVHHKQALVLINHNKAGGKDILELARMIQNKIEQQFGIELEPEVRIF